MNGHLLAASQIVLVASQLVAHLLNGEATPQEGAGLAILREDQVFVIERSC